MTVPSPGLYMKLLLIQARTYKEKSKIVKYPQVLLLLQVVFIIITPLLATINDFCMILLF